MVSSICARVALHRFPTNGGFTLAELLVVVSVIALLSTVFFAGFRSDGQALALERSARSFVQTVDQVRALSLSGGQHEGQTVSGGFGFYVQQDQGSVLLFADCNGDGEYQENGASSTCADDASEAVETVALESGITFDSISPCTSGACTLTVVFVPPYAASTFSPNLVGTEAIFVLKNSQDTTRQIRINTLGVTTTQ